MKTKYLFIIAVSVLLAICIFSCKKDYDEETTYTGTVVNSIDAKPFPDLEVKVTDGEHINKTLHTDGAGVFSILVRFNEINSKYYLLIGDSSCVPVRKDFKGFGKKEIDLGIIEVEGPTAPVVKTAKAANITAEGATLGGNVSDDGRAMVTDRGICWSENQYPELDKDAHQSCGNGIGTFITTVTGLKHNTTYYFRAYATNRVGTSYGEQYQFTTTSGEAVVLTDSVFAITAVSAKCAATVVSDGGYQVTERGICWSKTPDPTKTDFIATEGSGKGSYICALRNLDINTTYYIRAYAVNKNGTIYGEQVKITTQSGLATVITNSSNNTTASSISIGGQVTNNGGFDVTERGICYSNLISEPTIDEDKISSGRGNGEFTASIKNLLPSTLYYARAYATNINGTSYGNVEKITTKTGLAIVSLGAFTNITALTAQTTVKVTDNFGATLKECGICWAKTTNPTTADSYIIGGTQSNISYPCAMNNLQPNTTYYVRAYATTDVGTSYSTQSDFTTKSGLPIVSTSECKATSTTISTGGNITSDGGYAITARGVCYSTSNSTPTISDKYTTAGIGTGLFSTTITDVSVSTTYYIRAYATNSIGTSYGEVKTITTGNGLPIVVTTSASLSGEGFILSGGNVTDDGGSPVIERGVCYGVFPNPDMSSTYKHTSNGSGMGYYTSNLGSSLSDVVYIRAYATNERGTAYGNQDTVNVSYLKLPSFEYNGYTYKVAPAPSNAMTYSDAESYCYNLVLYGYDDWVMPTHSQLQYMYVNRNSIGGFYNFSYWELSNGYFGIDFSTGKSYYSEGMRYVRPIRREK